MKTDKKGKGYFKKLLSDVTDNVKEGATFLGEQIAEKSAKAYVASSELVSETSEKIHEFSEKQALQKNEKKILARQEEIKYEFGKLALSHYLTTDTLHKSFLTTKAISNLVEEFKANGMEVEIMQSEIKKLENN